MRGDGNVALGWYRQSLEAALAYGNVAEAALEMEGLAMALAEQGRHEAAVRLGAAATARMAKLHFDTSGVRSGTRSGKTLGHARDEIDEREVSRLTQRPGRWAGTRLAANVWASPGTDPRASGRPELRTRSGGCGSAPCGFKRCMCLDQVGRAKPSVNVDNSDSRSTRASSKSPTTDRHSLVAARSSDIRAPHVRASAPAIRRDASGCRSLDPVATDPRGGRPGAVPVRAHDAASDPIRPIASDGVEAVGRPPGGPYLPLHTRRAASARRPVG